MSDESKLLVKIYSNLPKGSEYLRYKTIRSTTYPNQGHNRSMERIRVYFRLNDQDYSFVMSGHLTGYARV